MDDLIDYLSNIEFDFKKLIFPTIIILLYVGGFVYLLTIIKHDNKKVVNENIKISKEVEVDSGYIYVDVKGSVSTPGVYKLKKDSRVIDAIEKSGGITEEANTRYINLSKLLNDGDVVMVYSTKEINDAKKDKTIYIETPCVCEEVKNDACITEENKKDETSNVANTNNKININTASIDELKTLSGIGDAKAKAIIDFRTTNGNFKSIEDIKNVNGISESLFIKIKENITI